MRRDEARYTNQGTSRPRILVPPTTTAEDRCRHAVSSRQSPKTAHPSEILRINKSNRFRSANRNLFCSRTRHDFCPKGAQRNYKLSARDSFRAPHWRRAGASREPRSQKPTFSKRRQARACVCMCMCVLGALRWGGHVAGLRFWFPTAPEKEHPRPKAIWNISECGAGWRGHGPSGIAHRDGAGYGTPGPPRPRTSNCSRLREPTPKLEDHRV